MILLHFALLSEAQYFIEKLKLKKFSSNPKIYKNNDFLVLIGGVGYSSQNSLEYVFNNFLFDKAYNIGVAGSLDKSLNIGDLICLTHKFDGIIYKNFEDSNILDMERKIFFNLSKKYIKKDKIYIFKIISDYNEVDSLNKEFVKQLIIKNYKNLIRIISD